MTAKEYLSRIQTYKRAMINIELRLEELRHQAAGVKAIAYDKDRVQVSPSNVMEETIVRIDRELTLWMQAQDKYDKALHRTLSRIQQLDNPMHVEILMLRYVNLDDRGHMKSLEEISCVMHLSFYRTAHLHGEALHAFGKKYLGKK